MLMRCGREESCLRCRRLVGCEGKTLRPHMGPLSHRLGTAERGMRGGAAVHPVAGETCVLIGLMDLSAKGARCALQR